MKQSNRMLSVCALVLVLATAMPINADIARPSTPEKPKVSLNELRAALGELPGNGSAAQTGGSISQRLTGSSTRTLMAGLLMFLSLSFGGIWLARSVQTRGQKTVAAFLLCTAMIGAVAIITQANAGPPPSWQWRKLSNNLTQGRPTYASVNIEIVKEGNGIKLIVPVTPSDKKTDD
jgi:hypothetical protein